MISIIRWILTKRLDVEMFLVFANKTGADIIFRDEWEQDVRAHPNFHCYHVLEQPTAGWPDGTGRITAEILRRHLPPPGPETVLFLCGPPPMMKALEEILRGLGYPEESVILP
jgi:cytochrome-b5 reductase